ncbi:Vitamin K-dependent gamma-carboxylase [Eumeta japonica]|uniref:Vitamin K-dependent gamma-carboxylase n=1 Tax=Eumeta variegata TaxID=151549 RepID=A0A4C2A2R8_EUMVA|nr:Vitamin K-dependent gamma-carboxylase [Eumeta japonica]
MIIYKKENWRNAVHLHTGYNNWTNGLYGYSWDMMVHTWNSVSITVKVVDNARNKEYFLDPIAWTPNDRWARHGDMVYQFARCVEQNIHTDGQNVNVEKVWSNNNHKPITRNVSIYIDVWCSMNGRFQQRMFDPKVDLLQAEWSPFEYVKWLMPLLVDAEDWRHTMDEMRNEVHSWSEKSELLFVADFPGYYLENYTPTNLDNITLTVLDGIVGFEAERMSQSYIIETGDSIRIANGGFHKVHVLSKKSSYYMYTYFNTSLSNVNENQTEGKLPEGKLPSLSRSEEIKRWD